MCGIVASVSAAAGVSCRARCCARRSGCGTAARTRSTLDRAHGRAGLGHARLSIIDLATGDQPIASEDESLRIVVNGEFYDFEAIRASSRRRATASARAPTARSRCTSTRTRRALRRTSCAASSRSRSGTSATARCSPARDRFGIKPLYYALAGRRAHVASEIKALLAPGVPLRWDREAVFDMHRDVRCTRRPHGLRRRLPGAARPLPDRDGASARVVPYWDCDYPRGPHRRRAATRRRVRRACRGRARRGRPPAAAAPTCRWRCYLSGGLDSLRRARPRRRGIEPSRCARSRSSFDTADYDERAASPRSRRSSSGAEFYPIHIRAEHAGRPLRRRGLPRRAPDLNAHAVAKYLLSRAVRDSGVKVVLTGEGSDEVFAGYPSSGATCCCTTRRGRTRRPRRAPRRAGDGATASSQGLLPPCGQLPRERSRAVACSASCRRSWRRQRPVQGASKSRSSLPSFDGGPHAAIRYPRLLSARSTCWRPARRPRPGRTSRSTSGPRRRCRTTS